MRLFTAIDIPDDVRANLQSFVSRLKPLANISWSPVANLHITTKFIGEWPDARLEEMKQALGEVPEMLAAALRSDSNIGSSSGASSASCKNGGIAISIRGIGWFPNERRPRVFWAGVEAGPALKALAQVTERRVAELGVPAENRDFSPHLTLARIREAVPLQPLQNAAAKERAEFGSFRAKEFILYLSAGGRYTQLARYSLS